MSKKNIPYLQTPSLTEKFNDHIKDEFNERMLFSGAFGAGKSTFLKNYFDNREDFIVLKLYPVHYSIAQNEDVFELIKYDLVYELLRQYPDEIALSAEQYSLLLISQMFWLHHLKIETPLKLLLKAGEMVKGGAIPGSDLVEDITKIISELKEYRGKVDETEQHRLNQFIRSFKDKKGHIHESDGITELIADMLLRVVTYKKGEDEHKEVQTVLLIDDLDRLDPEHIFRLFNIFSAHYDQLTETNKFGFDKIIFVCDIENIRQMFSHRYGIQTEFNGYIDKFYSSEVFRFDIRQYLKESLKALFESKYDLLVYYPEKKIATTILNSYDIKARDGFYDTVSFLFTPMIEKNLIRLRNFQRFRHFALPDLRFTYKNIRLNFVHFPALVLFFNAERFFSRPAELETALVTLSESFVSNYTPISETQKDESDAEAYYIFRYCLPFLVPPDKAFARRQETGQDYFQLLLNEFGNPVFIVYENHRIIENDFYRMDFKRFNLENPATKDDETTSSANPNPYWFLLMAYRNIKRLGFL